MAKNDYSSKAVYWPCFSSDCCVSILILHHDPLSSRCYSSQSASQPPPQPGPGSAPRAARQHQMSPELTGTARRAHHDTSSRSPRQRPQRWTFTCHRHHTLSCILRGLSTLRWLCWRTDAGTNTQFKLGITGARQSKKWVTAENG